MSGTIEHYQGLALNIIESLEVEQALYVAHKYAWHGVIEEIYRLSGEDGHTLH